MDKLVKKSIQETNLQALVVNGGFQFTDVFFPYTSGKIGPYYVQSVVVEKCGLAYQAAIHDLCWLMQETMPKGFDEEYIIAGGESRDWDFSNPVAYELAMPHAKIYKEGKLLGADMDGKKVILTADLNNEGSSPRDSWKPYVEKAGGTTEDIYFYVDRMEAGVDVMKQIGLKSNAVVPLDSIAWDYLQKHQNEVDGFNDTVYENLRARGTTQEERDAWATKMLRSDAGFDKLVDLINTEKTFEKGVKILGKGYPDIRDEMLVRGKDKFDLEPIQKEIMKYAVTEE